MAKTPFRIGVLLILTTILVSCIISKSPRTSISSTQSTPGWITLEQLESTKTVSASPFDLRSISVPVTDGTLMLSIQADDKCYRKERIPVKITIKNLTNRSVFISKSFMPTNHKGFINGNIMTIIKDRNGKDILSPSDDYLYDNFWVPAKDYFNIGGNESKTMDVSFQFPSKIRYFDENEIKTPEPGEYFLRMIYESAGQDQAWGGLLVSNQIELCIIE